MEANLENQGYRRRIIEEINSQENKDRRSNSLEDWQVYSGDIYPYVLERLENVYDAGTIKEIPIVSTINISQKVVNSLASLYKEAPTRKFNDVSENQNEAIENVYQDMWFDTKMLSSNRLFKLQQQNHVLITPKKGKLTARPIKQHQLDVIPNHLDPEEGEIYIISGFDKYDSSNRSPNTSDNGTNEKIADQDDYKSTIARYVVWSKSFHFLMNGRGEILSEETNNPIGMIPIFEISEEKDLEYFIQFENSGTCFTIEYCLALSDLSLVCKMQGFAQAVLTAPAELMPQSVTIGPTKLLKLITNPNMEGEVDFKFASPNADIEGARAFTESLLAQYLSSIGLDPSSISGSASSDKFSSGVERLLAMVERFEASAGDIARYEQAEKQGFDIVKAWMNELSTEQLDEKYQTTNLSDDATISIEFHRPTLIQSEGEQLDIIERKMDLGLMSIIEAKAKLDNMTIEEAKDALDDISETKDNEEGSQPEVQPEEPVSERL